MGSNSLITADIKSWQLEAFLFGLMSLGSLVVRCEDVVILIILWLFLRISQLLFISCCWLCFAAVVLST